MKKLLLIVTMAAALSGVSAFGQGYFLFTGPTKGVWDGWSSGVSHLDSSNNVAFLWSPTGFTPSINSLGASTQTNSPIPVVDATAAWNAILTDTHYQLAQNQNAGNAVAVIQEASNGAWNYNAGVDFPVTGTAPGTYSVFVIGWNRAYATPAAAAAAGSPVGWSSAFNYTAVDSVSGANFFATSGFVPFGVAPVPEPSTFALAGLGAAAMLIFRRRK